MPQILATIYKQEGIAGYFKGNGTNVCRIFPYTAVELFSFEVYKAEFSSLLGASDKKGHVLLFSGAASGLTAATLVLYTIFLMRRYTLSILSERFLLLKSTLRNTMGSYKLGLVSSRRRDSSLCTEAWALLWW
jgi:hypothetical protein